MAPKTALPTRPGGRSKEHAAGSANPSEPPAASAHAKFNPPAAHPCQGVLTRRRASGEAVRDPNSRSSYAGPPAGSPGKPDVADHQQSGAAGEEPASTPAPAAGLPSTHRGLALSRKRQRSSAGGPGNGKKQGSSTESPAQTAGASQHATGSGCKRRRQQQQPASSTGARGKSDAACSDGSGHATAAVPAATSKEAASAAMRRYRGLRYRDDGSGWVDGPAAWGTLDGQGRSRGGVVAAGQRPTQYALSAAQPQIGPPLPPLQ